MNKRPQKTSEVIQRLIDETPKEDKLFVGYTMLIAACICDMLTRQGMKQKEFAEKLGKDESEISKWLSGTHNFSLKTLSKIETVLGEPIIVILREKNMAP